MKSFRRYIKEALNIKGIQVPEPDIEDDDYQVYTYPGPSDILRVGIGPREHDGRHHVWFSHGGSFDQSPGETKHTPEQTMRVLNTVAATIHHHSKKYKTKKYSYELSPGYGKREKLYQRGARALGIDAENIAKGHKN
jgi:hypothetical protein